MPTDHRSALIDALIKSWDITTTYCPEDWTATNPSWGQCATTSVVLYDSFRERGHTVEFVMGDAHYESWGTRPHYWIKVNGVHIDLTRQQFPLETIIDNPRIVPREVLVQNPWMEERVTNLATRFATSLFPH